MTREEYMKGAAIDSTRISESQLKHMTEWVEAYIKLHLDTFKTVGISPIGMYNEYVASTTFPVGPKAFAPCLYLFGLEKIGGGAKGYKYVLFN
jgi:hypothetical protein